MIVLVRHGRTEANARGLLLGRADPGLDDEGRRQADLVARALSGLDVARVVTSPLARCRATAEAIAADLGRAGSGPSEAGTGAVSGSGGADRVGTVGVVDAAGGTGGTGGAGEAGGTGGVVEPGGASGASGAGGVAGVGGLRVEVDERWIELDYGSLDGVALTDVPADSWAAWRADVTWAPEGGESLAALGERVRSACAQLAADAAERDVVVVSHVSPIKAAVAWTLGVGDDVSWRMWLAPASISRIGIGAGRPTLRSFNELAHLG